MFDLIAFAIIGVLVGLFLLASFLELNHETRQSRDLDYLNAEMYRLLKERESHDSRSQEDRD